MRASRLLGLAKEEQHASPKSQEAENDREISNSFYNAFSHKTAQSPNCMSTTDLNSQKFNLKRLSSAREKKQQNTDSGEQIQKQQEEVFVASKCNDLANDKRIQQCEEEEKKGRNPLFLCAKKGWLDIIKKYVEQGADVNAKNENDVTALHMAAHVGHKEICKYLVEQGADIELKDKTGKTPNNLAQGKCIPLEDYKKMPK